jgi:hypothetical protein
MEFAVRLGVDNDFASVIAQTHHRQSQVPQRWSDFLLHNCGQCKLDPETCSIFNADPEQCPGESTPNDLRNAYCSSIEHGQMPQCPLFEHDTGESP